ncbi:MAG TPA: response regulator [Methanoregulaceae archaeon]|nr:response regulator [Methanoregulaceae archaeon]
MTLRILVMDDEVQITELIQFWLTRCGYDVAVTYDGEAAITVFANARRQQEPFDVVILDLIVPRGLGGQATLGRLRELDPEIRAIVCSGYAHDPVMALYETHGFDGIVPKPFKLSDLGEEIVRVASLPAHRRDGPPAKD